MPEGKLDYRPHERSSPAGGMAWFLVLELGALTDLLNTGENRWTQPPGPSSVEGIVGARLVRTAPVGETVWDFFFDAIHHRGQLTAYLAR